MDKSLIILVQKPPLQQILCEENVNKPDILNEDELMHYGILGMKWGVRRYQNKDGTLTQLGKAHLANLRSSSPEKAKKFESDAAKNTEILLAQKEKQRKKALKKAKKALKLKKYHESDKYKQQIIEKAEKAAKRKEKVFNFLKGEQDSERLKKKYIKQGPQSVVKHIDMFSDKELNRITRRYEYENKLRQQKLDKSNKTEETIKHILRTANYANDAIKWYNSSAGKTIRQLLGDPTYYKNKGNWSPYYKQNDKNKKKQDKKPNN